MVAVIQQLDGGWMSQDGFTHMPGLIHMPPARAFGWGFWFSFTWSLPSWQDNQFFFYMVTVAFQEDEDSSCFEARAQKSHNITFATFDWPKQITEPAEMQGVEK